MKNILFVTIGTALLYVSCAGTNKQMSEGINPGTQNLETVVEVKPEAAPEAEINEVEEKLVPIGEKLPDPHSYFVIIGSFRVPENAKKQQGQIQKKGFQSEILKNEAGLFRVSVMSTDEITGARDEIRRIRREFPEYSDTWLLIQKK